MLFHYIKARAAMAALVILFILVSTTCTLAQNSRDSVKTKIRPYKEIVPASARTSRGLFLIHKVDDRYLAEIPNSLLGRDMLVVNRIVKAPGGPSALKLLGGVFSYTGDEIGHSVIRFDKLTEDKVFLRSISFDDRASDSSSDGLYRNLVNNIMQPIEAAFPIKAINEAGRSVVIDLTEVLGSENAVFYFNPALKPFMGIAGLATDRSYIQQIKAFPMNIEIRTVRTYNGAAGPGGAVGGPRTYELNSSIVLLPETPMQGRPADNRVGFFAEDYIDFDANPQGIRKKANIWRWRMEPKTEDRERYLRGELVEPAQPIVIYIDPLTPKKWVPYLIAGINDWQAAFEAAGFRHAIVGKEAPVDDSTWSLEDTRHSVLVYHPSEVENASGPNVHDPRSGEILETHINWYHNVMDLLYKWYFIQAGAIDARARKPRLDDPLMGQLIRFVSSHEVGHTLGLMHNFGASSTVPVENLRNKAWVEAHGHTPSIMDYARFNYVAQPEDGIGEKGIFPRIGDYDKWAIRWGYRWLPASVAATAERDTLNNWIVQQLASGPQYFYGAQLHPLDPMNPRAGNPDPRDQNEDLGDDAMKAGEYGIRNLKRIEPHLLEWTSEPYGDYTQAGDMYRELVGQYGRYMGHVLKNIGGILTTPKTVEQPGNVYDYVPREKQKRAMAFLQKELFATPEWLRDHHLYHISSTGFGSVEGVQKGILDQLLSAPYINRLAMQEEEIPAKAYTVVEMLNDLKKGIFSELTTNKPTGLNRRNLQKAYVTRLLTLLPPDKAGLSAGSDASSVVKAHARELAAEIKHALPNYHDVLSTDHLKDLSERLMNALDPKR